MKLATMKDKHGYAKLMNEIPKYVVSNSLTTLEWNNSTLIEEPIIDTIIKLKEKGSGNLLIFGSGGLISF